MIKALGLLSGGLDSTLAVKVLQEQAIEVTAITFVTPFFSSKKAQKAADTLKIPIIVKNIENPEGAKIIYSMWGGYLTDKFREYCDKKGLIIEQVHTSGHAIVDDLKLFAKALNPKVLIPIHTFDAGRYPELFDNVKILDDNEAFTVE